MTFLIVYDLKDADEERYKRLWDALDKLGAMPRQKSAWVLFQREGGTHTCKSLVSHLEPFMVRKPDGDGDRLIVAHFDSWAFFNLEGEGTTAL